MPPWKSSEEKITELCERIVSTNKDDNDSTEAVVELMAALRERIRQIKDRASEVRSFIVEKRKPKNAA